MNPHRLDQQGAAAPVATMAMRPWHVVALLGVMILWAACYPLIAVGRPFAPPLLFAALRALVAGAALALLSALLHRPLPRDPRVWGTLAAIGVSITTLGFLGMFNAEPSVPPGLATVIAGMQPLIAAILAYFVLGERLHRWQRLGLVLGFLGIVVISAPHFGAGRAGFAWGLTYICLAALGVAAGNVLITRLAGQVDMLVAMAAQTLFGALPLGIMAMLRERPAAITWSPTFLASLLALALFGTAAAYWLWFMLLERVPFSRANGFSFLVPFIGFAIGVAYFNEPVSIPALSGLAMTAIGLLLIQREVDRPSDSVRHLPGK